MTKVLSKELGSRRIRVNSINPRATFSEGKKSAGLYGVDSEGEKQLVAMTPLGRIGTPEDRITEFLVGQQVHRRPCGDRHRYRLHHSARLVKI